MWTALASVMLAAALPPAGRALAGPQGATIHVRWRPSVTESERRSIEARLRLAEGERLDGSTWRYDLIDVSSDNILALIIEPAVADTHNIDRPNNALDPRANRTARRQRFQALGDLMVAIVDGLAIALAAIGALLALIGVTQRMPRAQALWSRARKALQPPTEDALIRVAADPGDDRPYFWTAAVLMISAPFVVILCVTLWQSPVSITEVVALLEDVAERPLGRFFSPNTAFYRPLFHITLSAFWHNAGSLDATLAWIKLLTIVPVVLLVVLLTCYLRPRTALDAAAATVAVAVLVGSAGFRDNLEIGLVYTIVGMPIALIVWIVLNLERRIWQTPLIVVLTLVAIGFKEQGLTLVPLVIVAWWTRAPGASRGMAATLGAVGLAYVAFRLAGGASWEPFQQDVGLGFTEINKQAAAARFGAFPYWIYAYNGASTLANILFSEPTRGTFRIVQAMIEGEPEPWQLLYVGSSVGMTSLIAWWGIRSVRRTTASQRSMQARLFIALVLVLLASGALSFNYSRDRLGGMAVVFYAVAAYFAVREAVARLLVASPARLVVAGVGLALLAVAWQTRAIATLEYARTQAERNQQEWLVLLPVRRIDFAHRPVYVNIMESMVEQGTAPKASRRRRLPDRVYRTIGGR